MQSCSYLAEDRLEDGVVVLRGVNALQLYLGVRACLLQCLTQKLIRGARVHRAHGLDLARALDVMQ